MSCMGHCSLMLAQKAKPARETCSGCAPPSGTQLCRPRTTSSAGSPCKAPHASCTGQPWQPTPAWGAGQKKAREIWFLSRLYDAREALDMGLVNTVVPLAELEAETLSW